MVTLSDVLSCANIRCITKLLYLWLMSMLDKPSCKTLSRTCIFWAPVQFSINLCTTRQPYGCTARSCMFVVTSEMIMSRLSKSDEFAAHSSLHWDWWQNSVIFVTDFWMTWLPLWSWTRSQTLPFTDDTILATSSLSSVSKAFWIKRHLNMARWHAKIGMIHKIQFKIEHCHRHSPINLSRKRESTTFNYLSPKSISHIIRPKLKHPLQYVSPIHIIPILQYQWQTMTGVMLSW